MNRKNLSLILTSVFTLLLFNPAANADHSRYNSYVNYDLLCESADGLQYVAQDLKDCFSADFRQTGYYGKLISRTSRIKHLAKRLHRRGLAKSTCNWRAEIQTLDDLVSELDALVEKSVYYNRTCNPQAVRKVRSLLRKAQYQISALERSLRNIEYTSGPSCYGPRPRPVTGNRPLRYDDVAPGYIPRNDLGHRVNRPDFRETYTRFDRDLGSHYRTNGFDLGRFLLSLK